MLIGVNLSEQVTGAILNKELGNILSFFLDPSNIGHVGGNNV